MKGNKRTEKYALTCSWAQGLASLTEESTTMATYETSYKMLRCAGDTEEQNKSVRSPKRKVGEFRVTWHVCFTTRLSRTVSVPIHTTSIIPSQPNGPSWTYAKLQVSLGSRRTSLERSRHHLTTIRRLEKTCRRSYHI